MTYIYDDIRSPHFWVYIYYDIRSPYVRMISGIPMSKTYIYADIRSPYVYGIYLL